MQEPERYAGSPDSPLVFFVRSGNALRLVAGDALAKWHGLGAGLTLADARTRFPALLAIEQDVEADRQWLDRLARDCIRYSPTVTATPPDGICIDIAGSAHLFGGEKALIGKVADRLAALGMAVQLAYGTTAEAARALARHAPQPIVDEHTAIGALPVSALGLPDDVALGLQRVGLTTVAAAAARPMASIASRFGLETVRAIDRLLGREQTPATPMLQSPRLRFERRFAEPVTHHNVIARSLLELLQTAAHALQERALGGRAFRLQLHRSDGTVHGLNIETSAPTRDPALVLRLFDERIDALADPLDPGFGYDSLLLTIPVIQPLTAVQPAFDDKGKGNEKGKGAAEMAVSELVDRLTARLGPGAVRRFMPRDSHIPEQAQIALPAIQSQPAAPWPTSLAGEPPSRPLFLFDPPQQVEVIAEVPDGPPHRFRWRRKLHEVRRYEGPERIATEWWQRKGGELDGKGGLTRDYYRVEDARGRRFWIFRHGLYDEKPNPRWYVHGLFA